MTTGDAHAVSREARAPAAVPAEWRLARRAAVVIVVKVVALVAIWQLWFSGPPRGDVLRAATAAHMVHPAAPTPIVQDAHARP